MRVAAPDGAVRGVDGVTGRRYESRDGVYDMHPTDAAALLKAGGFTPNLGGRTRGGWRCPDCGFAAFIRTCSRCGGTCTKENSDAPA